MLKLESRVYKSIDEGKVWEEAKFDGTITGLQRHPYDKATAIIGTSGRTHWITRDRGQNWDPIEPPLNSATTLQLSPWSFHPTEPEWLIYLGETGCNFDRDEHCHGEAFYSIDAGRTWSALATWVRSCSWAQDADFKVVDASGIYCEQYDDRSGSQRILMNTNTPVKFIYTPDLMHSSKVLFDAIVGYAVYSNYLIVAEYVPSQRALRVAVTTDGTNFSPAHYPANIDVVNPVSINICRLACKRCPLDDNILTRLVILISFDRHTLFWTLLLSRSLWLSTLSIARVLRSATCLRPTRTAHTFPCPRITSASRTGATSTLRRCRELRELLS